MLGIPVAGPFSGSEETWDVGAEGYRLGEPGAERYSFTMQNKPYRIWSVFSTYKNLFNHKNESDLKYYEVNNGR